MTMTTVSSPAMVPSTESHATLSMAEAKNWAAPGGVRSTVEVGRALGATAAARRTAVRAGPASAGDARSVLAGEQCVGEFAGRRAAPGRRPARGGPCGSVALGDGDAVGDQPLRRAPSALRMALALDQLGDPGLPGGLGAPGRAELGHRLLQQAGQRSDEAVEFASGTISGGASRSTVRRGALITKPAAERGRQRQPAAIGSARTTPRSRPRPRTPSTRG